MFSNQLKSAGRKERPLFLNFFMSHFSISSLDTEIKSHILDRVKSGECKWDWGHLSDNPYLTWDVVSSNQDKPWDWRKLCLNPSVDLGFTQDFDLKLAIGDDGDVVVCGRHWTLFTTVTQPMADFEAAYGIMQKTAMVSCAAAAAAEPPPLDIGVSSRCNTAAYNFEV
jgi:hypothetical protein